MATTPKNKKNKYKKTINYGYFNDLYLIIVILIIFFKYAKIIMKCLDSSKISSITRIEQIALRKSK